LFTLDFNEHGQFSSSIVPAEAFGLGDRAARLIPSGDLCPEKLAGGVPKRANLLSFVFNHLRTLSSLFCSGALIISFLFYRLPTLGKNTGGVPKSFPIWDSLPLHRLFLLYLGELCASVAIHSFGFAWISKPRPIGVPANL